MPKTNKTESQAGSVFQLARSAEEMTDPAQSSIQSPVQEQEMPVEKGFPPELLSVNQKALQRFLATLDSYSSSNSKMFMAGTTAQSALAHFGPDFINIDIVGIDFASIISNRTFQVKMQREFDGTSKMDIKNIKIKNQKGDGNDNLILADYYIFLEQSTGRGMCVPKERLVNIKKKKSSIHADVYGKPEDFWMNCANFKTVLNEDGEIEMTDYFWRKFNTFLIERFDECL